MNKNEIIHFEFIVNSFFSFLSVHSIFFHFYSIFHFFHFFNFVRPAPLKQYSGEDCFAWENISFFHFFSFFNLSFRKAIFYNLFHFFSVSRVISFFRTGCGCLKHPNSAPHPPQPAPPFPYSSRQRPWPSRSGPLKGSSPGVQMCKRRLRPMHAPVRPLERKVPPCRGCRAGAAPGARPYRCA